MPPPLPPISLPADMPFMVEMRPLSDLIERYHPRNPKDHDLGYLIQLMREFGFTDPGALDERTGYFCEGHGRTQALDRMKAQRLKPPLNIQVYEDEWFVPVLRGVSFVDDTALYQYLIAHNRANAKGGWNEAELASLLKDIALSSPAGLPLTGYDGDDLDSLLAMLDNAPPPPSDAPTKSEQSADAGAGVSDYQQKTFTLHDQQARIVDEALKHAMAQGHGADALNENKIANALTYICERYLNG